MDESSEFDLRITKQEIHILLNLLHNRSPQKTSLAIASHNIGAKLISALGHPVDQNFSKPTAKHPTVQKRLCDIYGEDISLEEISSFEYSWHDPDCTGAGYEKLDIKHKPKGGFHFSGVYHPNVNCEGGGVCKHCGITLEFPNDD